mmetsp:Transcript_44665/g.69901  ORF Transcript_44665/g.69901 Transcript_44665/m.69901 type:complete len:82 (-) Transcript_44665:623-868(-)
MWLSDKESGTNSCVGTGFHRVTRAFLQSPPALKKQHNAKESGIPNRLPCQHNSQGIQQHELTSSQELTSAPKSSSISIISA